MHSGSLGKFREESTGNSFLAQIQEVDFRKLRLSQLWTPSSMPEREKLQQEFTV